MILTYIHPISLFLAVKEQVLSFHSAGFYLVSIWFLWFHSADISLAGARLLEAGESQMRLRWFDESFFLQIHRQHCWVFNVSWCFLFLKLPGICCSNIFQPFNATAPVWDVCSQNLKIHTSKAMQSLQPHSESVQKRTRMLKCSWTTLKHIETFISGFRTFQESILCRIL